LYWSNTIFTEWVWNCWYFVECFEEHWCYFFIKGLGEFSGDIIQSWVSFVGRFFLNYYFNLIAHYWSICLYLLSSILVSMCI
jgi:hypothetical protein